MAEYSVSKSLRTTPKVVAGLSPNAFSERFLDAGCLGVRPNRFPVDDLQRCADPRSLETLTAGCDSANERIAVETAVSRPYYTQLPLSADGISRDYTPGGGYDTLGVRREEAFSCGGYYVSPGCACSNPQGFNSQVDKQRFDQALRRHYDKRRFANACQ